MTIQPSDKHPTPHNKMAQQNDDNPVTNNEDDDEGTVTTESSSPTRERKEPDRLTFCQSKGSKVTFADEEWGPLKLCHNLMVQEHPNPEQDRNYSPQMAMAIARVMTNINIKLTVQ
jgi:hypothetical protein